MNLIDISQGVAIGGFHYSIETDHRAQRELQRDECNGQCFVDENLIILDGSRPPPNVSKTFLHELLEAINTIYCHNSLSHDQITSLGYGIHQAMESLSVRFGVPK